MPGRNPRASAWKFRLHRLAAGLGGLALTVNAILIAVVISADVDRLPDGAGRDRPAPVVARAAELEFIAGHPARQVMLGVLVPALFVLALTWLASTTWRYEAVRPPYRVPDGHASPRTRPGWPPRPRFLAAWPTTSSGTVTAASG